MKEWKTANPMPEVTEALCQAGISPLTAHLLAVRGFQDPEQALDFLHGPTALSDPFSLLDMDKAVSRIRQALEEGETICVYGDFDCDGVTATALLYTYLQSVGADVFYYIPDRDEEGYGMNMGAVAAVAAKGTGLLITVDNGIAALDEIAYAGRLGLDVVVTDHHRPREVLPVCCAVVDPHRKDQPAGTTPLAGVGVAFQLVRALEDDLDGEMLEYYSDLAALGTIADLVPLQGENRLIVRHGLESLSQTQNMGLKALIEAAGLLDKRISAVSAAFILAPRINAAGRLGQVEKAMELLLCEDEEEAAALAQEICEHNKERQRLEAEILKDVALLLSKDPALLRQRVLLLAGEGWHPGVIGIVCAKVVERFGKPCILFSKEGDVLRGSGRSVDGFDIIGAISRCHDLLERYGGHPAAAGLTLQMENYPAFCGMLQSTAAEIYDYMPTASLLIDKSVAVGEITLQSVKEFQILEPFGSSNPPPVFLYENCQIEGIYPLSGGKHLRLKLSQNGQSFYAVYFNMTPQTFPHQVGEIVDAAVSCDINLYQGQEQLSVKIPDIRPSGFEQEAYFKGREQYERFCREEAFLPDTAAASIPNRESIAFTYRALREKGPVIADYDGLYTRFGDKTYNYCAFRLGLEVLAERGLVLVAREKGSFRFSVAPVKEKIDLEASPILQKLKSMKE